LQRTRRRCTREPLKERMANKLLPIIDILIAPAVAAAALLLRTVRRRRFSRMPVARRIFRTLGVMPITTHYYDPWASAEIRRRPLSEPRALPGLDLDVGEQVALLQKFRWGDELKALPLDGPPGAFRYRNGTFGVGDAEILYSLIRLKKPKRILEVGGGNSTLAIALALKANRDEDASYACSHICIEPFHNAWLDGLETVQVVRERVETADPALFTALGKDDILFIDSSHVIRPQGDVLYLNLEMLPRLAPGTIVHVHDIFTPRDYPSRWLDDDLILWNEQYLLEALLSGGHGFKTLLSLNMLYHDHPTHLLAACPVLEQERGPEPGSFWIVRQ
jgi:hypothetical protein